MQRVIGFETPAEIEQVNWQGEFNLHNIHTDLSETVYYTGAGLFLMLIPLARDFVPDWGPLQPLRRFAPGAGVAAVGAGSAMFNYGHWNLIPIQLTAMIAFLAMLAYGDDARRRGAGRESLLFFGLAAAILVFQSIFLLFGHRMIDLPNATEFKEFFLALGLGWYAFDQLSRRQPAPALAQSAAE